MKPFLSVVIPSYNEMSSLKRGVLDRVIDYLKKQTYEWEVILSDDGSTDGTSAELDKFAKKDQRIRVLHNVHAGKAPTVKAGMLVARGKWRLFTDFDQSTPISEVERLLKYAKDGYDVVIGSREILGAIRDKEPFYRHFMGWGFNILVRAVAIPGVLDTQCGFKLFSEAATIELFNKLHIYGSNERRSDAFTGAFDVELLFLAQKNGYRIREIPITWKHNKSDRVSPVKDSLRMLRDVLRIRIADWRGRYQGKS
jgi:dolichyl-phosphate beta-glucosyltransferase